MLPPNLHAGCSPQESPNRTDNRVPVTPKKSKPKKNKKTQQPQQPQQPRLTDEQWTAEVQKFCIAMQGRQGTRLTDATIQAAWKSLRQAYSNKFNAVITSTTSLGALEPFPFWAAENLETEDLERVLRVEFAHELSTANYMPSINSAAVQAKISIWHLVLYFGQTLFSETRLYLIKKRLRVFMIDPEDSTWPFTNAYKAMLRHAVVTLNAPEIDTTSIPSAGGQVFFKTAHISKLAPANPEFSRGAHDVVAQLKHVQDTTGMTGIPLSKKNANRSMETGFLSSGPVEGNAVEEYAKNDKNMGQSQHSQRYGQNQEAMNFLSQYWSAENVAQAYGAEDEQRLARLPQISAKEAAPEAPFKEIIHVKEEDRETPLEDSQYHHGGGMCLPPLRQNHPGWKIMRSTDSDFALPTTEGTAETECNQTTESAVTLRNGKRVGASAAPQTDGSRTTTVETMATNSRLSIEHYSDVPKMESVDGVAKISDTPEQHQIVNSNPIAMTPSLSIPCTLISRKRKMADDGKLGANSFKRVSTTNTQSHTAERALDWDDEKIISVLKQLEAMRPDTFIIVDGLKTYDNQDLPDRLFGDEEKESILLLPLKVDGGHRLLVVINLRPTSIFSKNTKQGVIQYYDPEGGPDSDSYYEPVSRVAQFIGYALPNRDPDPEEWEVQHCVCPDQLVEGNNGVCVCLAAICVVGFLPHAPLLPEETDWMFWRHTINVFLLEDTSVQLRAKHYRAETVKRLVRQGQVRGLTPAEPGGDDAQDLGHTVRKPRDRVLHRSSNANALIEMVHQGFRMFHNLQEHIDLSHARFRTELDRNILIREAEVLQNLLGPAKTPLRELSAGVVHQDKCLVSEGGEVRQATASIPLLKSRCEKLDVAHGCVRKAMSEFGKWRSLIRAAVEKEDDSIMHISKVG